MKHYARCINKGTYNLTDGKVYEVLQVKQDGSDGTKFYCVLNDQGSEVSPYASRFQDVSKPVDIKPPADGGWREYDFQIRSYDQIDEGLIARDLSIQEPMMVLESDERPGYYRVFLQVVPDSWDIRSDLYTICQPHPGNFPECRVWFFGCSRIDADTDPSFLRRSFKCRCVTSFLGHLAALSYKLINGWH